MLGKKMPAKMMRHEVAEMKAMKGKKPMAYKMGGKVKKGCK